MNPNLDCTIVLLSYNSLQVTDTCLGKIEAAIADSKKVINNTVKVIVVDNASKDGSAAMIAEKYPWVHLMALPENIGYARGNNLAMQAVDTPYMLLMNSDTYINPDSITKIFQKMIERTECDALVSKCFYADGRFQFYGGFLPSPRRIVTWAFGMESVPVIKRYIQKIYRFNDEFYDHEGIMQWCPPCFFLLKTAVYTKTGGFDEDLFFHMVDAEWCHRIHANGFVLGYTPTVPVIHLGGASSKNIQDKLLQDNFKGLAHFCKKHYPTQAKMVLTLVRAGLYLRSGFYRLIGKQNLSELYALIARDISAEIK